MKVIIGQNQSVLDIAIQYLGCPSGCFIVAERLDVSITDKLEAGQIFEYSSSDVIDRHVVDYYASNNIIPTTETD